MSLPEYQQGYALWSGPITLAQSSEFLPQVPYAVLREDLATGAIDLSVSAGPKDHYDRATMAVLGNLPLNGDPEQGPDPEKIAIIDRYDLGEQLVLDDMAVGALRRFWESYYLQVDFACAQPGDAYSGVFTVARAELGFRLDGLEYGVTAKGIVMGSLTAATRRHFYRMGLTETVERQYAQQATR